MTNNKIDYNIQTQLKILSAVLRDQSCALLLKDVLEPKYFEDEIFIEIADVAKKYMIKYNRIPSKEAIAGMLEDGKKEKEHVQEYFALLNKIYSLKLDDVPYVREILVSFAKRQALYAAIVNSVDKVGKGNFEEVGRDIKKALAVGESITGIGDFLISDAKERIKRRKSEQYITEKVATLILKLDECIGGGLGGGELGVVLGFLNIGKSIMLNHFGKAGLIMGKKIVHYTLEMSKESVIQRYEASLVGVEKNNLKDHGDQILSKLSSLTGEVIIKKYPTRGASVDTLRSHLEVVSSSIFKPDLVIVDYGDIMKRSYKTDSEYDSQKIIFEDLRALAEEINCPLWTATQATRSALNKEIVNVDDMADSIGKARIADVVLAMCMTEEEKNKTPSNLRLFMAKNRDNVSGNVVHCLLDKAKMIISIDAQRYKDGK